MFEKITQSVFKSVFVPVLGQKQSAVIIIPQPQSLWNPDNTINFDGLVLADEIIPE